jgi:hypothetical protein
MRIIKLSYLAILVLLWWLTANGYHSTPLDRRWFVFLLGITIGFVLGCLESRYTYDYVNPSVKSWTFPNDCLAMAVAGLIASGLIAREYGFFGLWFMAGMFPLFLYFGWPRP